ncbi:hypothetical protein ACIQGW_08480 [Lysinibacillus xylanilyticus]|uniref:hypothetical protein n=1 Tax=Lysinibacillus xylanilyticus TaxID=582475 RepID=UPI0037FEDA68
MSRLGQHDVGHEGVITGCDVLSLRSLMCSLQGLICDANPQGVAQSPLQSTTTLHVFFLDVTLVYSNNTISQQQWIVCAKAKRQQHSQNFSLTILFFNTMKSKFR